MFENLFNRKPFLVHPDYWTMSPTEQAEAERLEEALFAMCVPDRQFHVWYYSLDPVGQLRHTPGLILDGEGWYYADEQRRPSFKRSFLPSFALRLESAPAGHVDGIVIECRVFVTPTDPNVVRKVKYVTLYGVQGTPNGTWAPLSVAELQVVVRKMRKAYSKGDVRYLKLPEDVRYDVLKCSQMVSGENNEKTE